MSTSILFHSIITAGKKESLKKFIFVFKKKKKDLTFFNTLFEIGGVFFGISWKGKVKTGRIFSARVLILGFPRLVFEKASQMMFP